METRWITRGQSLVEFALVLPIFLLMFCGLLDAGRWVYAANALTQATRDASRAVSVESHGAYCTPTDALDVCAAKVVRGSLIAAGGPATVTTTCSRFVSGVETSVALASCKAGDWIDVRASIAWSPITPFLTSFVPVVNAGSREQVWHS